MDPKDCSPSDAVLTVSRLLAPAGGSPDPVDVRAAVVQEAARFFGVPSALLLELAEADRRVKVAASTGAGEPPLGGVERVCRVAGDAGRHRQRVTDRAGAERVAHPLRNDERAVRLLALRQPMASDLREVIAALKISSDIERIGDYAANVAKRVMAISQLPPVQPARSIPRMARLVQAIITDVLDAYARRDADKAVDVWHRDEEVDEMYTGLFRELLTYMMEDPRNITPCTHLIFIAKNIERVGDHATNVAETIYFMVHGKPLTEIRPKGDVSSFTVIEPGEGGNGG